MEAGFNRDEAFDRKTHYETLGDGFNRNKT